jgi:hypothetical protein
MRKGNHDQSDPQILIMLLFLLTALFIPVINKSKVFFFFREIVHQMYCPDFPGRDKLDMVPAGFSRR